MFGKRTTSLSVVPSAPSSAALAPKPPEPKAAPQPIPSSKGKAEVSAAETKPAPAKHAGLGDRLEEIKGKVFSDLIETVDLGELSKMSMQAVREELSDIIAEIMSMRNFTLSAAEQESVVTEICNDVLGLGPLEPLIARDDIADIMVNGANKVYIETGGKIELTDIKFRDNTQLMNICQRIVQAVGRRVDEASPICD
ncbi:MAG: CpaF family protein, partial [Alphaproteobacteria bacterium]|nr:CpaF family protein [Alphaproteobacteria bacterium]